MRLLVIDNNHDLWSLFIASGEKRKVASSVYRASISLDGSRILFQRDSAPNEVWRMAFDATEVRLAFALGQDDRVLAASWSPDETCIAYIRTDRTDIEGTLEIHDLQTNKSRVVLRDNSLIAGGIWISPSLLWLPDGRILFGLINDRVSDLWALTLDSRGYPVGNPTRMTNRGSSAWNPSVSADGKRLVVLSGQRTSSILLANLDKTGTKFEQTTALTNDSWPSFPESWTPDSNELFYDSWRKRSSIYRRSLSSDTAKLFLGGSKNHAGAAVSPDGKWLLAFSGDWTSTKWQLVRVPIYGGNSEDVMEVVGPAIIRCATTGSRICILGEPINKLFVFSLIDPLRGRLRELDRRLDVPERALAPMWSLSPDGSKIAAMGKSDDTVSILDLQSNQVKVIHPNPSQSGLVFPSWSADGKRLFICSNSDSGVSLIEMDLTGVARVLRKNPIGVFTSPSASPDGKHLAYNYQTDKNNAVLFEHF